MRRLPLLLSLLLGLLIAALSPVTAPAPAAAATTTARELLARLGVESETYSATYNRAAFRHWVNADGDSCDTREEVLIAESKVQVTLGAGCRVLSGRWVSWYDGATWTDPTDVDIDHVVALKEAWESGAQAWSAAKRERYANDLGHRWSLDAVTDNVNASKSDRDPASWLPPVASTHCSYAVHWVTVKYRWRLSVDAAERDRLLGVLSGTCGSRIVTVPARA